MSLLEIFNANEPENDRKICIVLNSFGMFEFQWLLFLWMWFLIKIISIKGSHKKLSHKKWNVLKTIKKLF